MLQLSARGYRRPKNLPANFKMSPPKIRNSVDRGKKRQSHVDTFFQKPPSKALCLGGAAGQGCTVGHSSGKHRSGLSPRLTVVTALVPAQQAGRQGLHMPPDLRKVKAGRYLWGPSGPAPLLKPGCTEPADQDGG